MPEAVEDVALPDPANMKKAEVLDHLGSLLTDEELAEAKKLGVVDLRKMLVEAREKAAGPNALPATEEPAEEVEAEVVEEVDVETPPTAVEVEDEVGKALALREQTPVATHALPSVAEYNVLGLLAHRTYQTSFVPQAYRGKEADVFAAFLFGREIGLGPMMALRDIYMIDGRPALAAHRQLAKLREGGVMLLESDSTRERAYIKAQRRDTGEVMAIEYTFEEAKLIMQKGKPLIDKDNWRNYPADMLWARCIGRLTRRLGPDLTGGLPPYVAEEVADFSDWGVAYDESGAPSFTTAPAAPNVRRNNEMAPPRTFAAVDAVVSHYGPQLGWREWLRDASELLFKTRDATELTVDQKTTLLQKASGACVALRESHEPGTLPPPDRAAVQKAWAHVLDGITLPGPLWQMSPDEADRPAYVVLGPEAAPGATTDTGVVGAGSPAGEPGREEGHGGGPHEDVGQAEDDIEWPEEPGYGG